MLVLFETTLGYALFKVLNETKLKNLNTDDIWDEFATAEKAQEMLQLVAFKKFKDTAEAVQDITRLNEGMIGKTLKKVLKRAVKNKIMENEELAVGEVKLGSMIKEKFNVRCIYNTMTREIMRAIRANIESLLDEHKQELRAMNLAVAHSLSRYKVKFNPDKIDTMIVQAVSLLDDLDKELNNYIMRCREWYGWHFPELGKLVQDHQTYAKLVRAIGMRSNLKKCDLSNMISNNLEAVIKQEAEQSVGTDISESDMRHIGGLCEQIIELAKYRTELADYLKNRMMALAPNLTVLLGELVGARLISHAGSLISLAKYPASTVQILGAEKALFRALKTKRDTPKYGLIYHAQLVGQASTKIKGKVARKLAAKVSLATRIDALADESQGTEAGEKSRAYIETFIRMEQERAPKRITGTPAQRDSYKFKSSISRYDPSSDLTVSSSKKRKLDDSENNDGIGNDDSKTSGVKVEVQEEETANIGEPSKKHKKKKIRHEEQ